MCYKTGQFYLLTTSANRTHYLELVRKARGEEAAERLKADVLARWEERKKTGTISTIGDKPSLS
ncbi:MAG: hypothetical protein L0312_32515 [Acidobacteria bacterium]|nr:hypothetical protein [Acidobacteriota bacterium]